MLWHIPASTESFTTFGGTTRSGINGTCISAYWYNGTSKHYCWLKGGSSEDKKQDSTVACACLTFPFCLWRRRPSFVLMSKTDFYIFVFRCLLHCCAFRAPPERVGLSGEDFDFFALVVEPSPGRVSFGYKGGVGAEADFFSDFRPSVIRKCCLPSARPVFTARTHPFRITPNRWKCGAKWQTWARRSGPLR